mmetsp:Transcript_13420/g.34396  ORF Transcript_13420/g.34396 Transcript_13420/m.34396 type:complete len:236 (-) Transcript_13420:1224-1931(-)
MNRSLVDALGGRDGGALLLVERVVVDRAVVQAHAVGRLRHVRERVLHPHLVVALCEVVPRVGAARLLASLRGVHGLRALDQEVLQLECLDQVRVPHERAVRHAHILERLRHLEHLLAALFEQVLHAEDCGVVLHALLQVAADGGGGQRAGGVAQLVKVGNRRRARILGQGALLVARLARLPDAVGARTAEDDDVEERVGAETVGTVDGGAGGFAGGEQTGHDLVGIVLRRVEHFA